MATLGMYLTRSLPALALGVALTTLASPSFAASPLNGGRESAIHECSGAASKYTGHTWQTLQLHTYRSCMAEHGEPE